MMTTNRERYLRDLERREVEREAAELIVRLYAKGAVDAAWWDDMRALAARLRESAYGREAIE